LHQETKLSTLRLEASLSKERHLESSWNGLAKAEIEAIRRATVTSDR